MSTTLNTTLTTLNTNTDLTTQSQEDAIMKKVAAGSSFLPYMQLYSNACELVKQGGFQMNHYGLAKGKDDVVDLGKEIDIVVLERRFKAMDLRNGGVLSYYTYASDQFQAVMAVVDSKEANSRCMYGPEFLIWIPSVGEFATFYMQSISAKNEAPKVWAQRYAVSNGMVTMKSKYVPRPTNSFQAIVCIASSMQPESLPTQEEFDDIVKKFKNPKDSAVSTVTAADTAAQGSRAQ
jgi:hypothetical protein